MILMLKLYRMSARKSIFQAKKEWNKFPSPRCYNYNYSIYNMNEVGL